MSYRRDACSPCLRPEGADVIGVDVPGVDVPLPGIHGLSRSKMDDAALLDGLWRSSTAAALLDGLFSLSVLSLLLLLLSTLLLSPFAVAMTLLSLPQARPWMDALSPMRS